MAGSFKKIRILQSKLEVNMLNNSLKVSTASFEDEVIKSNIPVIVKFGAPWCTHCRSIDSILTSMSKDYDSKIKFCTVDVDDEASLRDTCNIITVPALFMYKDGKVFDKHIGPMARGELKKFLDSVVE
jgi:thioredoxin 1